MKKNIKCPCCGSELELNIDTESVENINTFFIDIDVAYTPTVCELSKMGIELGITDEEVKNENGY